MRFSVSLRGVSLGFTAATLIAASAAWALPANSSSGAGTSAAAASNPSWLAGGTARLDRTLDSQTAKPGERIEAKLDHTVKTPDGMELPGGTQLMGRVAAVTPSQADGPSTISVLFNKAELKNGRTIPVKVTVTGAFPNDENQLAGYGEASMGPAERHVSLKDRFDQEPGTLSHIAMMSRASGANSATFSDKQGNVKLRAGTFLQLGIARRNGNMTSSGA